MTACPHYPVRKAFHQANFNGIIEAVVDVIYVISGVGTTSFTLDPRGYAPNFDGVVQVLEDLAYTISGISAGGGTVISGLGVSGIVPGPGLQLTSSGSYLVFGTNALGTGNTTTSYSGSVLLINSTQSSPTIVSGTAPSGATNGTLWFDQNEGRLFVYASGGVATGSGGWYQTNADAVVVKSEVPPSGTGSNAPVRDGLLWFNTLQGSLFIYDAVTSGWYETAPGPKGAEYSTGAPIPEKEGDLWYSVTETTLKVWNGTAWVSI